MDLHRCFAENYPSISCLPTSYISIVFPTSCICVGLEVFIGQPLSVKLVELQKLSEGIGPREAGPGDLPAIQNGMRVATAVTFQNTGSEACWRLAAAAAVAAAKPLVCGGNLTIDASVICQASGNGAADGGNGSGTFFFHNAEVAPLVVPKRSRTLFFFLPLDD